MQCLIKNVLIAKKIDKACKQDRIHCQLFELVSFQSLKLLIILSNIILRFQSLFRFREDSHTNIAQFKINSVQYTL